MSHLDQVLSIAEAAALTGYRPRTLQNAAAAGEILGRQSGCVLAGDSPCHQVVTIPEAAALHGVRGDTIREAVAGGHIEGRRADSKVMLLDLASVLAWRPQRAQARGERQRRYWLLDRDSVLAWKPRPVGRPKKI